MSKVMERGGDAWRPVRRGWRQRSRFRLKRTAQPGGAARYDRSRDLPALLALWPWEIENISLEGQHQLVARLRRALRLERQRAVAGHWTYDLARHSRLLAAYRSEEASLTAMLRQARAQVRQQV